ncbi:MAG: PGF-CTERM sorting domain-containing protein, partial [Euryarchaeota archaeon]|nr:PGF-CTERM sorting domain-containing protein [Euryarchaeota archaeon]
SVAVVAPMVITPMQTVSAASDSKVDVVVAGYVNHGPMQPTVSAIKEVTSKYGDKVSVTWVDLATSEGQAYYSAHGLSAHLNILINGKYNYRINGKDVTFQMFEGGSWTKADLDAVLASLVGSNKAAAVTPTPSPTTKVTPSPTKDASPTKATPSPTKASPSASAKTQTARTASADTTTASSTNQTNTTVEALPNNANSASSTPGFEAIFAIAGIVAVALIVKRIKK